MTKGNETKTFPLSVRRVVGALRRELGEGWFIRRASEFYGSKSETPDGLWTTNEDPVPETFGGGAPLYDFYGDVPKRGSHGYETFPVNPRFAEILKDFGFYVEPNDHGTLMIWKC